MVSSLISRRKPPPVGLSEDIVRWISAKKEEPDWMLEWRLKAYRHWRTQADQKQVPGWANVHYPDIDFQDMYYYSAPKPKQLLQSLDEVDEELLRTFDKLGIPLEEQKRLAGVAVDAIFDSVSIATTFQETLSKYGVIFCPMSEAVREHPDLVQKYLGSVVPTPTTSTPRSTRRSTPKAPSATCQRVSGARSSYPPTSASTTPRAGQFERTLIIADEGSYVSYLEGCSAPMRDTNQLHAAVVELVAMDNAEIKYSTIRTGTPGDENGKGGIYNFVTKRGRCQGRASKISWTQVETGSSITWKYPSCILQGDDSVGEFYSVALTKAYQQADTGTKMIHIGKNTRSTIISKGIAAGHGPEHLPRLGAHHARSRKRPQLHPV